ncbi:putative vacuolar transport protein 4A [Trypanosoma rangeli]|uniref:Putative vacuolar transport protein 4A n=1 Tax=Trypanosoma rangeli TaxID=5698 RepID=A0A422NNS9_TRYRA|nr:putative vacuolar transport protein 4A [Trypanosoma rangeli]RNF07029.1 putative vacuolar transport protein 4A [Trypanosoma rangeli]|eukprot:RNF07029.1 putative vacuolar transport protein 4A [Trypanosoma rangeli]
MAVALPSKKIDEALQLASEARELLLFYGHNRKACAASLLRIQSLVRGLLQCTSLMHAYDQTPYSSSIYKHVSRTFMSVLDLQLEGGTFSDGHRGEGVTRRTETREDSLSSGQCLVGGDADTVTASVDPYRQPAAGRSVQWVDIAGCEEAIEALKQATTLPLRFPQLFQGVRRPSRRILLYGPPGTGKTLLAAATATEYEATLLTISSADILSKWIGESEQHVRGAFETASQLSRCVLFFDEVDSICSVRGGSNESEASRRIKTELLLCMQSLNSDNVTVIAATNMPWDLDAAFRRRFDHLIFVGLPSPSARRQIFMSQLKYVPHSLSDKDFDWLVNCTEGYSASDIQQVAIHAVMEPVRKITQSEYVKPMPAAMTSHTSSTCFMSCSKEDENAVPLFDIPAAELRVPDVCQEDFEKALREFPPTVSNDEMEKFWQWRSQVKKAGV